VLATGRPSMTASRVRGKTNPTRWVSGCRFEGNEHEASDTDRARSRPSRLFPHLYNIAQTSLGFDLYHRAVSMMQNTSNQLWRLEANNPTTGTDWRFLWAFDRAEEAAYLQLIADLDRINRPVQLRIVRDTGCDGQ